MGPRDGLDTEARGKILRPYRGLNLDRPVVQSIAKHYTDRATPATQLNHCLSILGERGRRPLHCDHFMV
jgi:hypothetical protein